MAGYKTLLGEHVRAPDAEWRTWLPRLQKDPQAGVNLDCSTSELNTALLPSLQEGLPSLSHKHHIQLHASHRRQLIRLAAEVACAQ